MIRNIIGFSYIRRYFQFTNLEIGMDLSWDIEKFYSLDLSCPVSAENCQNIFGNMCKTTFTILSCSTYVGISILPSMLPSISNSLYRI